MDVRQCIYTDNMVFYFVSIAVVIGNTWDTGEKKFIKKSFLALFEISAPRFEQKGYSKILNHLVTQLHITQSLQEYGFLGYFSKENFVTSTNNITSIAFFKDKHVSPCVQAQLCQAWCRSKEGFWIYSFQKNVHYSIIKKILVSAIPFSLLEVGPRQRHLPDY